MVKVCLISNLYPPISRGGAEKVTETVARGLRDAGHEVFVISTRSWNGWASLTPTTADEQGMRVYRFYPFNIFYYLNDYKHNVLIRFIWHFFDMFNHHSKVVVKKILRQEKPNVVMTHNLKGIGYLIPRLIRKLGIKYVHTLHDVQLSVPRGLIIRGQENSWQQKTWLRKIYEAICQRLFNSPDVVISPSQWLMNFYTEKGFFKNSKKVVLPNPVETSRSPAERLAVSPTLSRGLRLLYLGQIEEHKGILFLVNVLKSFDIDFKLHIAGDGSKMEELKKIVSGDSRFIIHGKLSSEEVAKIFNEIDLTIVPSLCYENSPTVIYESLAAGVPVLAAKIGGVAELVKDGENGFTFQAGNADDLIRVIKHCATHRADLQKMRPSAAKSVENFKIENYVSRLLEIIK